MINQTQKIVWALPVRLIHWLIAIIVVTNLFFAEGGDEIHRYIGYFAVVLVFLRVIWGFRSDDPSAFKNFPMSFAHISKFLKSFFNSNDPNQYSGHNPMASMTYIVIWSCILFLGLSGYLLKTDMFFGEEWLEDFHKIIAQFLEFLIIMHFLGIIADSVKFKRKTWKAMLTGKKD